MDRINQLLEESVIRLREGTTRIQVEYNFLSRYLTDDQCEEYAKAFAILDELANVIEDKLDQ